MIEHERDPETEKIRNETRRSRRSRSIKRHRILKPRPNNRRRVFDLEKFFV